MITNSKVTIYHKTLDKNTRLENWIRFNYDKVWFFGGKGASVNQGYTNANDVNIRIPYDDNEVNIDNFSIGDIIVKGRYETDIETQQDIHGEIYNITSITNNTFGNNQHIHIGGK